MTAYEFKKLDVWQKSMDFVTSIYSATKSFPKEELYTLTSQLRRAAISIPSNISEGRAKRSTRDFMRYISMASGSGAELETQTLIAERLGYLSPEQTKPLMDECEIVSRMLNKLYSGLEQKLTSNLQPLASIQGDK